MFFKGFQAVQAYRLGHWLWQQGRESLSLFLQNRIATVFDVDIHPAARIGRAQAPRRVVAVEDLPYLGFDKIDRAAAAKSASEASGTEREWVR